VPVRPWTDTPANTEADVTDKPDYVQSSTAPRNWTKKLRDRQLRSLMPVDALVARVFATLEELGEEQNTLAFFVSDNGLLWYEHGLLGKHFPYDDAVRVPYFVRWPGRLEAGQVSDQIVANIDVAPTVYEAAGVTPTYTVDGESILSSPPRSYIFTEHFDAGGVPTWEQLWSPGWTYVRYATDPQQREYYDDQDVWQLDNLYGDAITGNEPRGQGTLDALLDKGSRCAGDRC
jgi:arylsulfatase A-like enzyme